VLRDDAFEVMPASQVKQRGSGFLNVAAEQRPLCLGFQQQAQFGFALVQGQVARDLGVDRQDIKGDEHGFATAIESGH
jgi:hypothetical protein